MIQKDRGFAADIISLERLLHRGLLPDALRERIEGDLARRKAGLRGEQSFDYYLSLLPEKEVHIFKNLRLPLSSTAFMQIDFLILTTHFYLIFEIKHIAGQLLFEQHQLIRSYSESTDSFQDPVLQVKNQQYHLSRLLQKQKLSQLPGHPFVVVTSTNSIIQFCPDYPDAKKLVIRPAKLPSLWEALLQTYKIPRLSDTQLKKMTRALKRLDQPFHARPLSQYGLTIEDLDKGVYCRPCNSTIKMERVYGNWHCPVCGHRDQLAHYSALLDFYLLVDDKVSVGKLAAFLDLNARTAARLLKKSASSYTGENRGRRYHIPIKEILLHVKEQ